MNFKWLVLPCFVCVALGAAWAVARPMPSVVPLSADEAQHYVDALALVDDSLVEGSASRSRDDATHAGELAAQAPLPQTGAAPTASHGAEPRVRERYVLRDRTIAVEVGVYETTSHFVVRFKNYVPPPHELADLDVAAVIDRALVRHETAFGTTNDFPATRVANSWIAAIPKSMISVLPGTTLIASAAEAGRDPLNPSQACVYRWITH